MHSPFFTDNISRTVLTLSRELECGSQEWMLHVRPAADESVIILGR
jgi:hypothetical protein